MKNVTAVVTTFRRPVRLKAALTSLIEAGIDKVVVTTSGIEPETMAVFDELAPKFSSALYTDSEEDYNNNEQWLRGVKLVETDYTYLLHDDDSLNVEVFRAYYDRIEEWIAKPGRVVFWEGNVRLDNNTIRPGIDRFHSIPGDRPSTDEIRSVLLQYGVLSRSPVLAMFPTRHMIRVLTLCSEKMRSKVFFTRPSMIVGNDLLLWLMLPQSTEIWHISDYLVFHGGHADSETDRCAKECPASIHAAYNAARELYLDLQSIYLRPKVRPVVFTIMYCEADRLRARMLACLLSDIAKHNRTSWRELDVIVAVATHDKPDATLVKSMEEFSATVGCEFTVLHIPPPAGTKHVTKAAYSLSATLKAGFEKYPEADMFVMEPDCVPMCRDWMSRLLDIWRSRDARFDFMGSFYADPILGRWEYHINTGHVFYANRCLTRHPWLANPRLEDGQPIDGMYGRQFIAAGFHNPGMLNSFLHTKTYGYAYRGRDAVTMHGVKDPSDIYVAYARCGLPQDNITYGLQYWHGENAKVVRLLETMRKLQPGVLDTELVLYTRFDTDPTTEVLRAAEKLFGTVTASKCGSKLVGWPEGSRGMIRHTILDGCNRLYKTGGAVVAFEADCVPVVRNWHACMLQEWDDTMLDGKLSFGYLTAATTSTPEHINGNFTAGRLLTHGTDFISELDKLDVHKAWDTHLAGIMLPVTRYSQAIANKWNTKTMASIPSIKSNLPIFLHGVKDDSVHQYIDEVIRVGPETLWPGTGRDIAKAKNVAAKKTSSDRPKPRRGIFTREYIENRRRVAFRRKTR